MMSLLLGIVFWMMPFSTNEVKTNGVEKVPLDWNNIQRILTTIRLETKKYEGNVVHPEKILPAVQPIVEQLSEHPNFIDDYPFETALLFRVYGGAYIMRSVNRENQIAPYNQMKTYLRQSSDTFKKLKNDNRYTHDQLFLDVFENINDYHEAVDNIGYSIERNTRSRTCESLKNFLKNLLVISMPTTDIDSVRSKAEYFADRICGIVKSGMVADFQFLRSVRNLDNNNLGEIIDQFLDLLVLKQHKDTPVYPEFYETNNKNTRIEYNIDDRGDIIRLHWEVNRLDTTLVPVTPMADILTEYFNCSLSNDESLEFLLDKQVMSNLDKLILITQKLAEQGDFQEAIIRLIRLTKERPDYADGRWFMAKTMYWYLSVAKNDDQAMKILALLGMPQRMKNELTEYLKLAPNGEYAEQARTLVGSL